MKATVLLLLTLPLGACGPTTARPGRAALPTYVPIPVPQSAARAGLDKVIGQDARALTGLFGTPDADLTEGLGRKMQFGSRICVLDAYLYSPKDGRGTPVVTHVDTRQRDGSTIDRASCVAALTRRDGGK